MMSATDWGIVVAYLLCMLAIGAHFRRLEQPTDFFLAGRSMRWFPVGLSIMITAFSAINYIAFSGEVFSNGLYVALSLPVFVIVAWPITRVIMPFYHSMQLCSAYEYLERRFDARVRILASGIFILWRVSWMAVALYVPCRIMSAITGASLSWLVLIGGSVTTLYTMFGGIRAVMWTDVIQFFVLLGGIVAGISTAAVQSNGFWEMLRRGVAAGLARPFHPYDPKLFSFDPTIRITLWSALIGTFVAFLARYGADQMVVQRYFTARGLSDARRGFHLSYLCSLIALVLLACMGFAIHSHSAAAGQLGAPGRRPEEHFAAFVASLPMGVTGFVVASIFAATMSSMDSGINSCVAAYVTDFHPRLRRRLFTRLPLRLSETWLNRVLTLALGAAVTVLACYVGQLGTVFEIANKIINALGSPLLALLLLGMFSRRATSEGMLVGGILGTIWSAWASVGVKNLALHYYAVVNLVGTLTACYLCSIFGTFLGFRPKPAQLSWTWRERRNSLSRIMGHSPPSLE